MPVLFYTTPTKSRFLIEKYRITAGPSPLARTQKRRRWGRQGFLASSRRAERSWKLGRERGIAPSTSTSPRATNEAQYEKSEASPLFIPPPARQRTRGGRRVSGSKNCAELNKARAGDCRRPRWSGGGVVAIERGDQKTRDEVEQRRGEPEDTIVPPAKSSSSPPLFPQK